LGCLQKHEDDAKNRVSQQVEVVSNMQPAKAALLLSVQEADIAVQILQLLDPKKASKIFNLMDKEVSARLQKQYMNMKR
jgi:flagellar motility protein MotE (MotC chaperone)